jgi:uncharacterized protein YhaN
MSKKDDQIDQITDAIKDVLEKAKSTMELNQKVSELLKDSPFEVRMSVLNMASAMTIMNEAEDELEALGWMARFSQQMMGILDKHAEDGFFGEEDEDHGDETLQ